MKGILKAGSQVSGRGQVFEIVNDVDFSSPFDITGASNRLKIPNFDNNGRVVSYTITKREAVVNGVTKIYRKVIGDLDQKPFLKVYLPENNILGVTAVIHKDGSGYGANPTSDEFISSSNKWYEVKSLIEDKVFIPDPTSVSDADNFTAGNYIQVTNKFTTEYTPEGYFSLTFGSGNVDPMDNLDNYMTEGMTVNLATFLNNTSLGVIPKSNTTLFVQYRVGGGKATNIGVNVITTMNSYNLVVNGPNSSINDQVSQSIRVTNVTPAVGGADAPTVDEIRNMIAYNFAAQNRAVTLNDYKSMIETMPSTYGAPAKVSVMEEDNKIRIKLLSYDENGALIDTVSTTLANNVLNYLSNFRMLNDFLDIQSGEVIDLGLQIDLVIDKNQNSTDIIKSVIDAATSFFDVTTRKMGDPLFVGNIHRIIGNVNGVVNVVDIRVYNKIGGNYSSAQVAQPYVDPNTMEIMQSDNTIYMKSNQIFQVRFPSSDIQIRTKTLASTTY